MYMIRAAILDFPVEGSVCAFFVTVTQENPSTAQAISTFVDADGKVLNSGSSIDLYLPNTGLRQ